LKLDTIPWRRSEHSADLAEFETFRGFYVHLDKFIAGKDSRFRGWAARIDGMNQGLAFITNDM
jgi:hypothetical protein